ncbi:FCD domain-containing protein [Streptomyces sp. NPDC096324]|uniref:FCD domain-containing protein n=1 Tax=Streptomyces sp. NPDC096324 TaxID=3366085 RepID=UPI0037FCD3E0
MLLTIDGIVPRRHQLRVEAWRGWKESGKGLEPIIEAHALILDRIRERDPEAAARAMREHLGQAREGLVRLRDGRREHPGHDHT